MDKSHSDFHSSNAFCGNAGPEEMRHLQELVDKLSNKELKQLVAAVGIKFLAGRNSLDRDNYERVIDEADREVFYREYRSIIALRNKR